MNIHVLNMYINDLYDHILQFTYMAMYCTYMTTGERDREGQAHTAIAFSAPTENTLRHWVQILWLHYQN